MPILLILHKAKRGVTRNKRSSLFDLRITEKTMFKSMVLDVKDFFFVTNSGASKAFKMVHFQDQQFLDKAEIGLQTL